MTTNNINETEWNLRVKLAATYRIFDYLGWSLLIFNHITLRLPGPKHHFLINPFGLSYNEVKASNLVKVDIDGNKVDHSDWNINQAGFVIHSAIHKHIPEAICIMHTHTVEGIAVSCKEQGLANTNFYSAMIHNNISYHDFEGITTRENEQQRLITSIGKNPLLILRNHGLLGFGRNIEEAFIRLWTLQKACETQLASESLMGKNIAISDEVTRFSTNEMGLFNEAPIGQDKAFEALERIIEKQDPSYKN
ncbi:MAG: class II aldolase/adducin family protein [Pseudomonadota bacterium]|nr:class II aldolase/adducin family protein [Pseudomonadota bacterium]